MRETFLSPGLLDNDRPFFGGYLPTQRSFAFRNLSGDLLLPLAEPGQQVRGNFRYFKSLGGAPEIVSQVEQPFGQFVPVDFRGRLAPVVHAAGIQRQQLAVRCLGDIEDAVVAVELAIQTTGGFMVKMGCHDLARVGPVCGEHVGPFPYPHAGGPFQVLHGFHGSRLVTLHNPLIPGNQADDGNALWGGTGEVKEGVAIRSKSLRQLGAGLGVEAGGEAVERLLLYCAGQTEFRSQFAEPLSMRGIIFGVVVIAG